MVANGDADGFVGGVSRNYADVLRPTLELIGADEDAHCIVGCYMMNVKGRTIFLADATVNVYPDSRTLAEIAVQTAKVARRFGVAPVVAMLSFSNFGSSRAQRSERIEDAIEFARELDPSLVIDGPMQADTALNGRRARRVPIHGLRLALQMSSCLPNLAAANIAYKLLEELGDAEMTGPILEGMSPPCPTGCSTGWCPSHCQHGSHLCCGRYPSGTVLGKFGRPCGREVNSHFVIGHSWSTRAPKRTRHKTSA